MLTLAPCNNFELINYLDLAMNPEMGESAVIDFTFQLFRPLGYVHPEQLAIKRVDLPLFICGENKHAEADVCIIDYTSKHILLVQAVERLKHEPVNAPAQLVAEAVAVFNMNNARREVIGHPPLADKVSRFMSLLTLF
jgi:hypothetical protein